MRFGVGGSKSRGFSLVEVTVAIGIVSFALLGLVGLLSMGFKTNREAMDRVVASQALNTIAECILGAGAVSSNQTMLPPFQDVTWTIGGPSVLRTLQIGDSGQPETNASAVAGIARLEIFPPLNSFAPGKAVINMAWPAHAQWDGTNWQKQRGSLESVVYFLP